MKVGFLTLTGNSREIRQRIESELKSSWLDYDTVEAFRESLKARKDTIGLKALLLDVEREIRARKKEMGHK